MPAVLPVCRNIDLGVVELNDLVSSASYSELVEMQNFVFRDSRSMIHSFSYDDGAGVGWTAPAGQTFAIFSADIPEGIDQILITSRAESAKLVFVDVTAGFVTMATNSHSSPADTLTATYLIPAPGVRLFGIDVDTGGTVNAILIEWDATAIP